MKEMTLEYSGTIIVLLKQLRFIGQKYIKLLIVCFQVGGVEIYKNALSNIHE